ncbi:hypothetical protein, partial [Vibrio parahaemolyticus]|uniref:hypothetical protein n=1 Tax=Vibrio parahaemolyticus TaxID=670 RepID=UPI001AD1AE8E|nr:hypothetical protein [Vibrio parahaemolyticus]
RVKERLDKAQEIGCIPVNFDEVDPGEYIKEQTPGTRLSTLSVDNDANRGVDKGIDAVGYQAHVRGGEREEPAIVLNT